jgi:hypothetical protein
MTVRSASPGAPHRPLSGPASAPGSGLLALVRTGWVSHAADSDLSG